MSAYPDTLKTVETQLAQVLTIRSVGICFLDESGRLVQILEEDPALRELIVEYHQTRLAQLIRSERAGYACDARLTKQPETAC